MDVSNLKLFIVEFGKPDTPGGGYFITSGRGLGPVFVIAKTYNDAGRKAKAWAEAQMENSVVDDDGSLKMGADDIKIKCIKIAAEELIA